MRKLIIPFLLLVAGCASTETLQQSLAAWRGRSADLLIQQWGPPLSASKLPNGSSSLVYEFKQEQGGYITPANTLRCTIIFLVGADNQVQGGRYEGNSCAATDQQAARMRPMY